jgi:hypothetical protein
MLLRYMPLLLSRRLSSLNLSHLLSLLTSALQLRAELGDIKGLLQNQTALIHRLTSNSPAATPTLNLPVRIWPRLHVTLGLLLLHDCCSDPNSHGVCVCVCVRARVCLFDPSATCDQMTGTFEARCKHQNLAWHHPDTTDSCRRCWRCQWCW